MKFDGYSARERPNTSRSNDSLALLSTNASLNDLNSSRTVSPPKFDLVLKSTPSFKMTLPQSKARIAPPLERTKLRLTHDSIIPSKPRAPNITITPLQTTKPRVIPMPIHIHPISSEALLVADRSTRKNKNPTYSFGLSAKQRIEREESKASQSVEAVLKLKHRRYLQSVSLFESQMLGPLRYKPNHNIILPSTTLQFASLLSRRTLPRFGATSPPRRPRHSELYGNPLDAFKRTQTGRLGEVVRMKQRVASETERQRLGRAASVDALRTSKLRGPGYYAPFYRQTEMQRGDLHVHDWTRELKSEENRKFLESEASRREFKTTTPLYERLARVEFWGLMWRRPRQGAAWKTRTISEDARIQPVMNLSRAEKLERGRRRGPGTYEVDERAQKKLSTRERTSFFHFANGGMDREGFARFLKEKEVRMFMKKKLRGEEGEGLLGKYEPLHEVVKRRSISVDFSKLMGRRRGFLDEDDEEDGSGDTLLLDAAAAWKRLYDDLESKSGVDFEKRVGRGRGFSCPPAFDEDAEGDTLLLNLNHYDVHDYVRNRQPVLSSCSHRNFQFRDQVSRGSGVFAVWNRRQKVKEVVVGSVFDPQNLDEDLKYGY
eukprot:GDKJ01040431.1.p1 GENE.GDKJ01040431.1~~GDKJ01040431.1.p1  ORF type:complete len:704 (-),score=117.23 GDKJ01040431.1:41-1849(-)